MINMTELEILEFAEKMSSFLADKQARKQSLIAQRRNAVQALSDISAALNTIRDTLNDLEIVLMEDEVRDVVTQPPRELQRE